MEEYGDSPQTTINLGKLLTQFCEYGNYICVENKLFRYSVSCKNCRRTCIPKASWESANDMLKGDMMTFGCSGVVSRFCRSCSPSF